MTSETISGEHRGIFVSFVGCLCDWNIWSWNKKRFWVNGGQKGWFWGPCLVPRHSKKVELLRPWYLVKSDRTKNYRYDPVWYLASPWHTLDPIIPWKNNENKSETRMSENHFVGQFSEYPCNIWIGNIFFGVFGSCTRVAAASGTSLAWKLAFARLNVLVWEGSFS